MRDCTGPYQKIVELRAQLERVTAERDSWKHLAEKSTEAIKAIAGARGASERILDAKKERGE